LSFTLNFPSQDGPRRAVVITLALYGWMLGSLPGSLVVSADGCDRAARWIDGQLVLDRVVAMESHIRTTRILGRIPSEELPNSAGGALEAASRAGAEAGTERCELCGVVFPANQAAVHAMRACPRVTTQVQTGTDEQRRAERPQNTLI
jgi:hypothetical protein